MNQRYEYLTYQTHHSLLSNSIFLKKKLLNMMISLQEKSLTNNMPFLLIQIKINFSFLETISIFLSLKRNYMQCNFSALTFSCLQFKRRIKLVIHIYI